VVNLDVVLTPTKGANVAPVAILLQGYSHLLRQQMGEEQAFLTGDARFRASLVQRTAGKSLQAVIQLGVWEFDQRSSPEDKLQLLIDKFAAVGLDFNRDYRKSPATSIK